MDNNGQKATSKHSDIKSIAKETAIIAASNSVCTPINYVLETIKTKKQQKTDRSYTSLVSGLYEKGGASRFFRGYPSYLVRNTAGCFFGSSAIVASIHTLKDSDTPLPAKMAIASIAEGTAETMLFPVEISELAAKTSKSGSTNYADNIFTKEVLQKGANASVHALSRNITYGAGIVIPYMMNSSPTVSFTTGIAAGLISLPFDVMATKSFAENTNIRQTYTNLLKADKRTAFAGAALRGMQIGLYSLATNQALHYIDNRQQQSIGR
ncbi:MAG: hypothetical protein PQ612_00085 [Rickettsiales bacterium]|nr:hypothetical protein [Pseudomonadota bacterium]MDA0965686.1 hypothetical protein [Pseudomonadota bacterium]MDG4543010.1 hypothetical protein [Rickettsiales bacterium]MDG4544542.1 hypothetical protein [Rickettsiales bacterium]MDG4546664.1 hypothetical protein [Rickettsiales bacterium]